MLNWKRIFISGPFFVAAILVYPGVYGMDVSRAFSDLKFPCVLQIPFQNPSHLAWRPCCYPPMQLPKT